MTAGDLWGHEAIVAHEIEHRFPLCRSTTDIRDEFKFKTDKTTKYPPSRNQL